MRAPLIPFNEQQRLELLRSFAILDTPPEERFDRLTRLAQRIFGVPIVLISLIDDKRQWFKSSIGLQAKETPRDISFCGHAILGDDVLVVSDAARDERFHDNPLVVGDPKIRFYAGCPLSMPGGSRLGTLCLISPEPRPFSEEDQRLLADLAKIVCEEIAGGQLAGLLRKLELAETYNHTVTESLQEALILFDSSGTAVTANAAAAQMFGLAREQLIGRSLHDDWQVVREDGSAWEVRDYPAALALHSRESMDRQVMGISRPDGETRWVSMKLVPTDTLPGEMDCGILVSLSDITELRRAEALSRQLELRVSLMVDSIDDFGIFMLDPAGCIATWNAGASSIKGYVAEEIIGQHFSRFYTDEDQARQKPVRALEIALDTGRFTDEGWRVRKDGSRFWAHVVISAIHDEWGAHIGFAKVTRDLSERRDNEMRLAEAHRFQRAILADAPYAIIASGVDLKCTVFNPEAERMLGYRADEVLGKIVPAMIHDPVEVLVRAAEMSVEEGRRIEPGPEVFVRNPARGIVEEREWTYIRKDGSRLSVMLAVSALRDEDERITGFLGIAYDTSARRRMDAEVAEANRLRNAILISAPYAIMSVDTMGLISAVNPAFERMLWYSAEEVVGIREGCMIHDPTEIRSRAAELSSDAGTSIQPGFETLTHLASKGLTDEREWTFIRRDGSRFPVSMTMTAVRDAAHVITGYVAIAQDITERKRREEYTQHVAHHDFLTDLPNRLLLYDRLSMALERARRSGDKVAVLILDLDHFKRVNDSLGHHIGDELLKCVANRLVACVRAEDTVARMGGDEFVVVLSHTVTTRDAERVAAKIVDCISAPMQVGSHQLTVTPSIGISCFPDDGQEVSVLLANADGAMYRAKAAGRSGYATFSNEMLRMAQDRLAMEAAIGRALCNDEFHLHYQPQVCLKTGQVMGMEALLRWNDPIRGAVAPSEFIPIAEECGLIVQLGEWVLRTACREARLLQQRTGRPLRLALNLSARQFRQDNLPALIRNALADSGLAADCLELEITETVLMTEADDTVKRLQEIRSDGVGIAIDDFGIGFSSLSYISRFQIDTLKIDRSFVSKLPDSVTDVAVTQAIIALAASLGIKVVAEGVETQQQLDFLRSRCCDAAQGYLLGRPAAIGDFSIQGWCFSEALSAAAFENSFGILESRGLHSIRETAH